MKYIILFLSPFFFSSSQGQQIEWVDWNTGYEKATKEHKIILVDAYTNWCGWCKKMDADTYTNPDVVKKINEQFVAIKFNPEIPVSNYRIGDQVFDNRQLYGMLCQGKSTGFPTTYYITPHKNSLFIDAGYKGPADFLKVLDSVIDAAR